MAGREIPCPVIILTRLLRASPDECDEGGAAGESSKEYCDNIGKSGFSSYYGDGRDNPRNDCQKDNKN